MKVARDSDHVGTLRLISSSIRRRLFRNIAIFACFAFITGTILTSGFLVAGAQMGVNAGMDRLGADLIVLPADPNAKSSGVFLNGQTSSQYFDGSLISDIESTPGVLRATPQAYVSTLTNISWCQYSVQVIGFDPKSDFFVNSLLLGQLDGDLGGNEVIVGHFIDGEIGSSISFFGQDFSIEGRMERTGFSPDNSVYLSLDESYAIASLSTKGPDQVSLKPGLISAILVKADRSIGIDPILYWIASSNPGVLVYPMSSLGRQVADQLSITAQALYLTTASVIIVSMPMVALIATMGANERRREIGLLRAMGAPRSYVFRLIFVEAVLLAMIGGAIGVIGASIGLVALQEVVAEGLNIDFLWPSILSVLSEIALALVVGIALAGIAALWPAYRASRMEPYDAMRVG